MSIQRDPIKPLLLQLYAEHQKLHGNGKFQYIIISPNHGDQNNPTRYTDYYRKVDDKFTDENSYKIKLDAYYYAPEEVSVTTDDENVIVEAKHEENSETHGFIRRQFVRRYPLAKEGKPKRVEPKPSFNGMRFAVSPKDNPGVTTKRMVTVTPIGPDTKEAKKEPSQPGSNGPEKSEKSENSENSEKSEKCEDSKKPEN